MAPLEIAGIVAAGVAAGFVNAIAGGASLIGLPALVALGLPPTVANASNNVATTASSLSACVAFARRGHIRARLLLALAPAALVGAWYGAELVVALDERTFSRVVGALMLLALALLLFARRVQVQDPPPKVGPWRWTLGLALFGGLGVYGGFFGGGLGLVVLPALALFFGLDLLTANGVKNGIGFGTNAVAFVVFWRADLIDWGPAGVLTAGMLLGSQLGVRWAVRVPAVWLRVALTVITVVAAIHFFTR